jgi:hypothetical protein
MKNVFIPINDVFGDSARTEEMSMTTKKILIKVLALFFTRRIFPSNAVRIAAMINVVCVQGKTSIAGYMLCGRIYSKTRYNKIIQKDGLWAKI